MYRRDFLAGLGVSVLAIGPAAGQIAAVDRRGVLIGTATPGGLYYPLGGAICRLFNLETAQHGLRCSAELSAGSVANIGGLRAGTMDAAIVQGDALVDAIAGTGPFAAAGPMRDLRLVFAAHDEPFTLVARGDAGITSLTDLAGKRVSIGNVGSGHRLKMERVMEVAGLKPSDFSATLDLDGDAQVRALCEGKADAIAYSVGHPNGLIQEALRGCGGKLIPISAGEANALIAKYPEYSAMAIPGGIYPGYATATPSFGISSMLVTTDRMAEATIYELVSAVFESFDDFQRLHPAFAQFKREGMTHRQKIIAFHPGTERYLRVRGWLN